MEQITIFVLGSLAGLLSVMVIGSFVMVLRMNRKINSLEKDNELMSRHIDELEIQICRSLDERVDETHRRIDQILNDLDREKEIHHRELDKRFNDAYHKIENDFQMSMKQRDELHSYIDKRFDKTIEAMCTRMDISIESAIAESKLNSEELLKS
jgi:hypothetical protein